MIAKTYDQKVWHGHVPGLLEPKVLEATVSLVKKLAEDLDYSKANFGMTVEGIIQHATELLAHERKLRGPVQSGKRKKK